MRKLYFVVLMSLISLSVFSQTTLYSENFGSTAGVFPAGWTTTGTAGTTGWNTFTTGASTGYPGASGTGHFRTGSTPGAMTLTYDNSLSTVGYTNIQVIWGARRTSTQSSPSFEWSNDGFTWVPVVFTDVANSATWLLVNGGVAITLPVAAEGVTNLRFRWTGTVVGASGYRIDDFSVVGTAPVQNYYSNAAGNLTAPGTWWSNPDGATGTQPTNFTTDNQIFNVVNRVVTTLDANWTVSGTGSKIIVGDGINPTELILPAGTTITNVVANPVDVQSGSTLNVQNNVYRPATSNVPYPFLGALAANSTVEYSHPGITITDTIRVPAYTFHHLVLTDGLKYFSSGNTTVAGNIIADNVDGMNGWYQNTFSTVLLSGDFTLTNGAVIDGNATGDVARFTLSCVGSGTQTLSGGNFNLFRLITTALSSTTLNIALAANTNLQLGNGVSTAGGLNLINASQTLSLLGNNIVTLYGVSRIQASNLGTISGNNTSTLSIAPTGFVSTIGTIGFTPGFQQLGTLSINSNFAGDNTLILSSPLTINTALNLIGGYINIGPHNLTVAGNITGGSGASFVQTTSTGTLTRNGVGAVLAIFPIGNLTYNPIAISNGSGNNFSARVALGIVDPSGAIPVDAVERTWYIGANVVTAGVTVGFEYNASDCSPGASAQPLTMEILQSDYTTWHLSLGNGAIPATSPAPHTVTSVAPLTINNGLIPYTLGVSGTAILAVDYFITAKAQKQNNNALISWTVGNAAGVNNFEVQRAVGNGSYQTIGTVAASSGQVNYQFTDFATDKGTNLYRIRVNRSAGGVRYSNTVAVINGSNGLLITGLWPNPAQDKAQVTLSTAKAGAIRFEIYGLNGVMVKSWTAAAAEGTNVMTIPTGELRAGVYQLVATGQEAKSVFRFIRQ